MVGLPKELEENTNGDDFGRGMGDDRRAKMVGASCFFPTFLRSMDTLRLSFYRRC
jgi:hypothetical protein